MRQPKPLTLSRRSFLRRASLAAATLGTTYGVGSYVALPVAIQIGLKLLGEYNVPRYTKNEDGLPADPINVGLIGTLDQLRSAFDIIGWTEADALGFSSSVGMIQSVLFGTAYHKAPFSSLYLFGRSQDIGFQRAITKSPHKRHHVRFWGLNLDQFENEPDEASFWHSVNPFSDEEQLLWIGAATRDIGLSLTRMTYKVTHATDANTLAERDLIMFKLQDKKLIGDVVIYNQPGELPARPLNHYVFDGAIAIARLL